MAYNLTHSFHSAIKRHIGPDKHDWVQATVLYRRSACRAYFKMQSAGVILICVRTKNSDYYFRLKPITNVAQYMELPPLTSLLPSEVLRIPNPLEIEAFKYPFSKAFTFLRKYEDN